MFKHLKKYKNILVTGPQRSGTRITAKMIAYDTGHRYIDERRIRNSSPSKCRYVMDNFDNIVIQCPALAFCIDSLGGDFVVFVIRDVEDIVKSQIRIGGTYPNSHFAKHYPLQFRPKNLPPEIAWPITVYKYWNQVQKARIERFQEIEYESLANHPLWIPKSKRVNFTSNQTT